MLIAQISDTHLGFERDNPAEFNRKRLDKVIARLIALDPRPDLLIVSGDMADAGDDSASYKRLRSALSQFPVPTYFCMGNHDSRAAFSRYFPHIPTADGFVQYAVDDWPLRILFLDTLEEGRHSGNFCETRAAWLRARLAEAPDRPTLIVLHHPPIESGLSWMTENPEAEWVLRLRTIVAAQDNIVAMVAGHLHRPVMTTWAGTRLMVCPSTAPQVALDLAAMDPERPDGRPMIVADAPGYALHLWNGSSLVSHIDSAEEHTVLARYEPALQPLVRMLSAEREAD